MGLSDPGCAGVPGKPSHPPRIHEFNAGVQLLAKCLQEFPGLNVQFVLNGWPRDERSVRRRRRRGLFHGRRRRARSGAGTRRRLKIVDEWAAQGVGIGFMHYGVEVVADQAGEEFKRWIGGHYEHMFSCNPIWEPTFARFAEHPITRGVEPFQIKDEWYFNMRFLGGGAPESGGDDRRDEVRPDPGRRAVRRGARRTLRLAARSLPAHPGRQGPRGSDDVGRRARKTADAASGSPAATSTTTGATARSARSS
jgi:hypothetical protein